MLFVLLKDHCDGATENGLQRVVTRNPSEGQCRQEVMLSWTCMVVVEMARRGWNGKMQGDEEAQPWVIGWTSVSRESEGGRLASRFLTGAGG